MPEETSPPDEELMQLLEAVANRELTPTQQARLSERLAADPKTRDAYIRAVAFDAMLTHEHPPSETRLAASALDLPGAEHNQDAALPPQTAWPKWVTPVNMLAAILLMITFVPRMTGPSPVATLVSSENASWESSLPTTPGSQLLPGVLQLKSGIATVRFLSGAEVILEAPAQLELITPTRGKLIDGVAVIDVPEVAIGFVMETMDGYAVDYGTRFAVQVDQKAGRSEFELIEGEIAVHHPRTGKEIRLTEPHKAVTVGENFVNVVDTDRQINPADPAPKVIRLKTNGRSTSVLRNNKRNKFIDPEVLAVKKTRNGKWDYRSFFSFDLSSVDVKQVAAVRLRLNLVPSRRGYASRLPTINRFGIYGLTNQSKADWPIESNWQDSPGPKDGVLLGTIEIARSQQRGTFGIANGRLLEYLESHPEQSVTFILIRETTQIDGNVPGLTHMFASDAHPEVVGPLLELTVQ